MDKNNNGQTVTENQPRRNTNVSTDKDGKPETNQKATRGAADANQNKAGAN